MINLISDQYWIGGVASIHSSDYKAPTNILIHAPAKISPDYSAWLVEMAGCFMLCCWFILLLFPQAHHYEYLLYDW